MTRITLSGRVVVITGAAGGLGSAYARECARRGAALLLTDVDADALKHVSDAIGRRGGIARAIAGDIVDPDFTDSLAEDAVSRWGSIDGWVNNAGIEVVQSIENTDAAAVSRMVDVNVTGTINGVRTAAMSMRRTGGGSIVNVTSGAQFGMEHLAVYGATKGAVASLTFGAALDLAGSGVRVNAISPLARTRMTHDIDDHFGALTSVSPVSPGLSDPDVVAGVVSYLVSDRSSQLTGQVIRLDGRTLSIVRRPSVLEKTALSRDEWQAEDIATALEGPLASSLHQDALTTGVASNIRKVI